jgi:Fe-Mn family superoxide dismutase
MQEFDPTTPQESAINRRDFLKMAATVGGSALAATQLGGLLAEAETVKTPTHKTTTTKAGGIKASDAPLISQSTYNPKATIAAKSFDEQLATVEGISQNQLKQHLGLYQAYIKKYNQIQNHLDGLILSGLDLESENPTYSPFRELNVELSYALNGAILHDLYFGNLGGPKSTPSESFKSYISKEFGSWSAYTTALKAVGKDMRGWAMTAFNIRDGRIHNYGLDTHNQWVPMHIIPLVVMDVYEHAYMIDFGTARVKYLDAFMANINWGVVEERLDSINHHHASPV